MERFYPMSLAGKRSEWLAYYAQFFPTVEINSTFYRVPTQDIVKSWVDKGSKIGKFEFSVKMHKAVTHEALVEGTADKAAAQAASFQDICLKPLAEAGLLGAVLIQMSPAFTLDKEDSMERLRTLLELLSTDRFKYAVEFRHKSWVNEAGTDLKSDVLDLLREFNVADVKVDGPAFPITRSLTANQAYVRLHGRNYDIWFKDESESDYRINRYDYLYSEEQLSRWKPRIEELMENAPEVRIYFNNHGRAKAVKNALYMMDLLGIPHEQKAVDIQDQMRLGDYF
ncbi:MAG: DUF72 domain-containing protein [Thermoplasmata archaeon]|nr:DUF72 domain-containing protein [Thermoplasmata archaeon]